MADKRKFASGWLILSSAFTGLSLIALAKEVVTSLTVDGLLDAIVEQYNQWAGVLLSPVEFVYHSLHFELELDESWRHYFLISFVWLSALARLSAKYENGRFLLGMVIAFIIALALGISIGLSDQKDNQYFMFGFLGFFTLGGLFARDEGLNILGPNVPRRELYWTFFGSYVMAFVMFLANLGASYAGV